MKIFVINGPNMNMLGTREPEKYGNLTLGEINAGLEREYPEVGFTFLQSNIEGEIVDFIQRAFTEKADGIVLNAAAYSHYSYAIRDAIASAGIPCVEVHMTNIHAREAFRRTSVLTEVCRGSISGFGADSYSLAVRSFLG